MDEDSRLILPLLQENSATLRSQTGNVYKSKQATTTTVIKELSKVSNKTLQALMQYYFLDLELMGYKFDPVTFRASCAIETEDGGVCC